MYFVGRNPKDHNSPFIPNYKSVILHANPKIPAFNELDQWLRFHNKNNNPAMLVGDFNMSLNKIKSYISNHFSNWYITPLSETFYIGVYSILKETYYTYLGIPLDEDLSLKPILSKNNEIKALRYSNIQVKNLTSITGLGFQKPYLNLGIIWDHSIITCIYTINSLNWS
ncbi:hypothetical protein PIROE2DRAFT_14887 [Piromyces sp. E2]|nr:hypothetical protein PIROE2DRAFT_14887 [Piromyces sp. E2]|eukprot:OUM59553.1 hypothetical protein PIROE2DRAFT_14887 [Piromyces sp. E2]